MKIRAFIIGLAWTFLLSTDSTGQSNDHTQESRYKPFRVLIISPDTARIDDSLKIHITSIEREFKTTFYEMLREFERERNTSGEEDKERAESIIKEAKWHEIDVLRYRYYHMISISAFLSLHEYFQKYPWENEGSLTCQIVNIRDLETEDLGQLTKEHDFDYIIYFRDIRTREYYYGFDMIMETSLFSRADSRVIMTKTSSGEARKNVCDIYGQNLLECLMINVANEATSDLFKVLNERQKK